LRRLCLENLVLTLHVIVCLVLVVLVLLQSGKEGMGVIFGGGSSSLFGSSGAGGILVRLTAFVAVLFICTSLGYNVLTSTNVTSESTILNMEIADPLDPSLAPKAPVVNPADPTTAPQAPAEQPAAPAQ